MLWHMLRGMDQHDLKRRRASRSQPRRREFPVGSFVVRGRADIVEEVIAYVGECVRLNALYLGKNISTEIVIDLPLVARAATPADHEQAKRYALRWKEEK
jgi:hypothetical protein